MSLHVCSIEPLSIMRGLIPKYNRTIPLYVSGVPNVMFLVSSFVPEFGLGSLSGPIMTIFVQET